MANDYTDQVRIKGRLYDIHDTELRNILTAGMSWDGIKGVVNGGYAPTILPVGTQIWDKWAKAAGTEYEAPWDVVHHFDNGDMALNWHYAFPDAMPFDQPEAIYYAPAGGLAAGTYYITIGKAYGTGWVKDAKIYFTIANAMSAGDQLVLSTATNNANNPTDGMAWNVYAKGSTTSKENGTTAASGTGTELGSTSSDSEHKTNGQINAPSRVVYGYNRWAQSAIRQWLNSAAAAGSWWSAQNGWDRPPSVASSLRGFLAGCSSDLLNILEAVNVVTAKPSNDVGTGEDEYETTQDKIFLPSLQEMYVTPQLADTEGVDWDYNKALAAAAGLSGRFATGTAYEILKKYNVSSKTSAVNVWLRSCNRGHAYNAWYVNTSGYVSSYGAYITLRGCPACIIKKSA